MASPNIFFTVAVVVVTAFAIPSSWATEYVVGDEKGWSLDFDYQSWAAGKEFRVGDKLVFKYTQGVHDVVKVNGTEFQQCEVINNTVPLRTGNDVITLLTPGIKWYICSVPGHCATRNMKLSITVAADVGSPFSAPGPNQGSQTPSSSARENAASSFRGWIAVIVTFLGVLLV
ncbi:hypothetical protein V6N13_097474 [Hibiscus sabdariffa]|uniref:Uncharacterized protein n=2 Tax=Hibiscus sabdariffa TaxID=183260 RepID=A0ABR2PCV1_9ROSI